MACGTQQRQQAAADIRFAVHHSSIRVPRMLLQNHLGRPQDAGLMLSSPPRVPVRSAFEQVELVAGKIEVDGHRPHPMRWAQLFDGLQESAA